MFWKKKTTEQEPSRPEGKKLPGPKEIPELVGRYIVTELKQNPDWVWTLKGVMRQRDGKDAFDFRIFDANKVAASKVKVRDYTSLDGHPELILYQGWFEKKSMRVHMEEKKTA